MQLSPVRFNRFLSRIGQDLSWRPSSACPCVQAYSGGPDPNCLHCDGKGRLWGATVATSAGIVSRDILRQAAPMAILDAGDVMLVIPSHEPVYAIGEYDRVLMVDRSEPFSLNLIPGNNKLRFDPISIDTITWIDEEAKLVAGTPPTGWAEGTLTWDEPDPPAEDPPAEGQGDEPPAEDPPAEAPPALILPPEGVTVAITGRRHPEYFCWLTLALDRPHHRGKPLPRRVILRRFDLFGA